MNYEDTLENDSLADLGYLLEETDKRGMRVLTRYAGDGNDRTVMVEEREGGYSIYPHFGGDYDYRAAYSGLREIRVIGEEFPSVSLSEEEEHYVEHHVPCLGTSARYGLTFTKRYKAFARIFQDELQASILTVDYSGKYEGQGDDEFVVSAGQLYEFKTELDTTFSRMGVIVGRIRDAMAVNLIRVAQGKEPVDPIRGRLPIIQKMTDAARGDVVLDDAEELELLAVMRASVQSLVRTRADAVGRFVGEVNLESLRELVDEFDRLLGDSKDKKSERKWQKFFQNNTFILQQLFGSPIVLAGDKQLNIKPARSDKSGSREADFVLVNPISMEGLIVEIKTPGTLLVDGTPYRGTGSSAVHRPSSDLSGAVAQLQSQMVSLSAILATKLDSDDPLSKISQAHPAGVLIVGDHSVLSAVEARSFAWYRNALSNVVIVTFDEVRVRLKSLCEIMDAVTRGPESSNN